MQTRTTDSRLNLLIVAGNHDEFTAFITANPVIFDLLNYRPVFLDDITQLAELPEVTDIVTLGTYYLRDDADDILKTAAKRGFLIHASPNFLASHLNNGDADAVGTTQPEPDRLARDSFEEWRKEHPRDSGGNTIAAWDDQPEIMRSRWRQATKAVKAALRAS